jgi:hypothetical protein
VVGSQVIEEALQTISSLVEIVKDHNDRATANILGEKLLELRSRLFDIQNMMSSLATENKHTEGQVTVFRKSVSHRRKSSEEELIRNLEEEMADRV